MLRRGLISLSLAVLLVFAVSCTNKKVQNPLADVGSKQPDKVLFDRAMDALKHNHYDVARITLQTLINTYPDSEYIARAKLAVGDSWYAEGGNAAMQQAEIEYKDFITFFPNMPEAAEAQLKIANIHYSEMQKPDRDFTHAERAEEEYRQLILQFPDSKLVPQAKERLREVQEVLAEREYRVGRFYYMRQSYPAAIARLKSLVERYPLYSRADDSLFMLGQAYEGEINNIRRLPRLNEADKGKLIKEFTDGAADAYSRILTRYPVMDRAAEAKRRLEALHRPIPTPTKEAIAQNKAEEESRSELGHFDRIMANFHSHPDVSEASHVGDPTLVDPKPVSATEVLRQATDALKPASGGGNQTVSGEVVKSGSPGPSQPVPRSDAPGSSAPAASGVAPANPASTTSMGTAPPASADSPAPAGIGELKPVPDATAPAAAQPATPPATQPAAQPPAANAALVTSDSSDTAPPDNAQPASAPPQVNEAATPSDSSSSGSNSASTDNSAQNSGSASSNQSQDDSTSKKKKKKGLGKLNPF